MAFAKATWFFKYLLLSLSSLLIATIATFFTICYYAAIFLV